MHFRNDHLSWTRLIVYPSHMGTPSSMNGLRKYVPTIYTIATSLYLHICLARYTLTIVPHLPLMIQFIFTNVPTKPRAMVFASWLCDNIIIDRLRYRSNHRMLKLELA